MFGLSSAARRGCPSVQDWIWFGILLGLNLLFVGLGELAYRLRWLSPGLARKLVHALVGVAAALTPFVVEGVEALFALGAVFLLLNGISRLRGWLPGMHAAESGWGTVLFVLGYGITLALCWALWPELRYLFTISMLVLALADPAAAVLGGVVKPVRRWIGDKTLAGSAAVFGVSLFVIGAGLAWLRSLDRLYWPDWMLAVAALVGAGVATAAEALCGRGWDNVAVPVSVTAVLGWMALSEPLYSLRLALGFGIGLAFVGISWRAGALSSSGAALTLLMAVTFFGLGGWAWSVPVIVFFVLSSLWSRLGQAEKASLSLIFEKDHRRDAGQVLANGGVAWLCTLLGAWSADPLWYAAYLGSLAAVTADTWATEWGTIVRLGPTWLITNGRPCPPGTSGGVSAAGTLAAAAGAGAIWASTWLADSAFLESWGAIEALGGLLVAGLTGSFLDSLLGALLQARFTCPVCGVLTERALHCGQPAVCVSGLRWVRNDLVNGAAATGGALMAMAWWTLTGPGS